MKKHVLFDLNRALDIWENARSKAIEIMADNERDIDEIVTLIEDLLTETVRLAGTTAISVWEFISYAAGNQNSPPIFRRRS